MEIGLPENILDLLRAAGQTPPSALEVRALVDTGASMSCISLTLAECFSLSSVGMAPVSTPGGIRWLPRYQVGLVPLVGSRGAPQAIFDPLLVVGAHLQGGRYDCLLGRDVLAAGVFTYVGIGNSFVLSF